MVRYPQIIEGERVRVNPPGRPYRMACCDCLLVHRLRFTRQGRDIVMQAWRDNRATAALRREARKRKARRR